MADTFGSVWRQVRLRCPLAPALLVQDWVRDAFRRAWDYRESGWSFARGENEVIVSAQVAGTVNVTRLSALVQGVGLVFAASDALRQFRAGPNQPVYTIVSVDVGLNRATLDRVFGGATAVSIQGTVLDAYVTMPADFGKFLVIIDPANFYQMRHWITEDELNAWDPQRSSTGTPWAMASRRLSDAGLIQYELWPYATGDKNYPFLYYKRPTALVDATPLPGFFSTRGDILRESALGDAARWPGTEDRKNPYFNITVARMHDDRFTWEMARLEVKDEDVYPTWLETISWIDRNHFSPLDSRYMQEHDV